MTCVPSKYTHVCVLFAHVRSFAAVAQIRVAFHTCPSKPHKKQTPAFNTVLWSFRAASFLSPFEQLHSRSLEYWHMRLYAALFLKLTRVYTVACKCRLSCTKVGAWRCCCRVPRTSYYNISPSNCCILPCSEQYNINLESSVRCWRLTLNAPSLTHWQSSERQTLWLRPPSFSSSARIASCSAFVRSFFDPDIFKPL